MKRELKQRRRSLRPSAAVTTKSTLITFRGFLLVLFFDYLFFKLVRQNRKRDQEGREGERGRRGGRREERH